ncbi:hypothetical protein Ga0123462_1579 [Mariprofundus ferrinatatus]|uniref:Uncharacterized protein n=1 Tax=Mariprofundus ferrinatatus TaxID=1921087 RepID=A0A2K8L543_9PROT|nr:hypothetical protein [Mariprofundus ferrinatatus]ATX82438.1 hypothetical protein Ga0123462_1579 [Mariprofundus ferrinatatus]
MTRKVRRIAIAGALLLVVTITLLIRLNIESINGHVQREMESYSDAGLQAEKASLSFLHGIGLRLDQVTLKQEHYRVNAGHMNIGIRLLPLLLGKIEVDTLDIHDAVIQVQPRALQPTSTAVSSLPFERINLVRCQIRTFDDEDLLNNLHLELRNIGANRETLWELQAKQDGHSVGGHGRLNFYNGEISTGFGKLKFDRVPATRLRTVTPKSVFAWFEGSPGKISGSLTLDITRNQTWAVFGELTLLEESGDPPLRLRGKLEHPEAGVLIWHDSFIHFNETAVIAINGECRKDACETGLDANNIELETWFPLVPESVSFHQQISGLTDINAFVQWSAQGWDSSAAFRLKDASFLHKEQQYPLPEIEMQTAELRGDSKSWLARVLLTSPKAKGELSIESMQLQSGKKEMRIQASDVEAPLWEPLANLLLSSLEIEPQLDAKGMMNGSIELQQHISGKILRMDLDAKQASLSYPSLFDKPANIDAACNVELRWPKVENIPDVITLRECTLDNSSLQVARWLNTKNHKIEVEGLHLHFDQLHNHAVLLPGGLSEYRGDVEGSGKTAWSKGSEKDINWFDQMSGNLKLNAFGTPEWHYSGSVTATNGLLKSSQLLLKGTYGESELQGEVNFARNAGDVDVLDASLDFNALPPLPSFLDGLNIRGRIHKGEVALLGNRIRAIHGYYRVHKGSIALENVQGSLANGHLISSKLEIIPASGSYGIAGVVRLKAIQIEQLGGVKPLLQADLKGRLHANIELHGKLPELNAQSWLQSNGDILIYSGEWNRQSEADTLSEHLGIKKPERISHAFKQFGFRFRINEHQTEISNLMLDYNGVRLLGKAEIAMDGATSGAVQSKDKAKTYSLGGNWPLLSWQLLQ